VWTLLDTGLRVSELVSLRPEDVRWQEGTIVVHGKGGPYGKKSKLRVVPLTERVRTLLERQFAIQNDMGISKRTAQRIVKKVADRARITRKVSAHVLRHTFAVNSIRKGISLPALQKVLGHDHLETTAIYLNYAPEDALREYREKW